MLRRLDWQIVICRVFTCWEIYGYMTLRIVRRSGYRVFMHLFVCFIFFNFVLCLLAGSFMCLFSFGLIPCLFCFLLVLVCWFSFCLLAFFVFCLFALFACAASLFCSFCCVRVLGRRVRRSKHYECPHFATSLYPPQN